MTKKKAAPVAPEPVAIPDAGESKMDANDELQERLKKRKGLASTVLSKRENIGEGGNLRQTLG